MNKAVISVLGPDRPGIIAAVTRMLFEKNCNIENVSQTILQSEFSGIFIVVLPSEQSLADLHGYLEEGLTPLNHHVFVKPLDVTGPVFTMARSEPFVITTKGPDRKGLVAAITEIIARYGVNVANLQAVFKGGDDPNSNIMIYEVDIPVDIDQQRLYTDLRAKATELSLQISIQHRNIFEAINRI
ncbi:MAG: ACT domain-containing protein [Desulfobacterales bacterium]